MLVVEILNYPNNGLNTNNDLSLPLHILIEFDIDDLIDIS